MQRTSSNNDSSTLKMITLNGRAEWLEHRRKYIGGSDAASIIGMNPWMSNVKLWEIKTGRFEQEDISDNPLVKYGTEAEEHIRALFALDHPEHTVMYEENNSWLNSEFPFAAASLDGWTIENETGRKGILEIKTSSPKTALQMNKWKDSVPPNYYVQILFYLMVTGWDYADLRALLHFPNSIEIRDYHIERSEVEDDIAYLREAVQKFARLVKEDKQPDLLLPEI